jgi:hypothetical protein
MPQQGRSRSTSDVLRERQVYGVVVDSVNVSVLL